MTFTAEQIETPSSTKVVKNEGNGILVGAGSSVQRSISRGNTGGEGLNLDALATFREVTTGTLNGGINAGGNVCNGSLTCP